MNGGAPIVNNRISDSGWNSQCMWTLPSGALVTGLGRAVTAHPVLGGLHHDDRAVP
jgi:hypothetical protein